MRKLSEIIKNTEVINKINYIDINISTIVFDSRIYDTAKVAINHIFVATTGEKFDGNEFITIAIKNGAKVIVTEKIPDDPQEEIIYITTNNSKKFLAQICQNFFDNPSDKIKIIGVTGTNGKTTTATLLYDIAIKYGKKAALLSTVENKINSHKFPTNRTTPDPFYFAEFISKAVKSGCEFLFMECSSHSLDHDRFSGVTITGAIFTNLTRDHLDYHKTFAKYARAKKKLFDSLPKDSFAVSNIDDKYGKYMLKDTKAKKIYISKKIKADFFVEVVNKSLQGTEIKINENLIKSPLIGDFNVYNLLGVYATALSLGFSTKKLDKIIEEIKAPKGVYAVVDYAHTPDALLKAIKTVKGCLSKQNKIISVVGCGGDRDKKKRSMMGHISTKLSQVSIFTSDNPRSEKPESIIDDIVVGIDSKKYLRISDRRKAIEEAIKRATPGDVVLVAGKGHENYQEIAGKKIHFSDTEEIKRVFKNEK